MSRYSLVCLLGWLLAGVATSEALPEDRYKPTTILQLLENAIADHERYAIVFLPEWCAGDLALLRDGDRRMMLAGTSLEFGVVESVANWRELVGAQIGVRYETTPYPHLLLERLDQGGEVLAESLPAPTNYPDLLPNLLSENKVDIRAPGAQFTGLDPILDVDQVARFASEERKIPLVIQSGFESLMLTTRRCAEGSSTATWYLFGKGTAYEVVDLDPSASYMLAALYDLELAVVGAVELISLASEGCRGQSQPGLGRIMGHLRLHWFRFAGVYIRGYEPNQLPPSTTAVLLPLERYMQTESEIAANRDSPLVGSFRSLRQEGSGFRLIIQPEATLPGPRIAQPDG